MDPPSGNGLLREATAEDDQGLTGAPALASRLDDITQEAATVDLRRPDDLRRLVGRYLDALLAHRALVRMVLCEPVPAGGEAARLVRAAMATLADHLVGAAGMGLDSRIRVTSALGAVHAVVLDPTEYDPGTVRDVITSAAVAILLS